MRGSPESLDSFAGLAVSTLVMSGGDSDAWMSAAAGALATRLSNATLQVLPGQTHQVDSAVLAAVITPYFANLHAGPVNL